MKNPEVFYYFHEQLKWLESRGPRALKGWFQAFLWDNEPYPLFISTGTVSPTAIIQGFFERSHDRGFKNRTKRVIIDLINEWRLARDPDEVIFELSSMVGYIGITGARFRLLSLVKEGYLKGRLYRGVDLHFHLLRVLAGLKLSIDLKKVIYRDFDNPAYAPILFVSSWLLGEKGYPLAIDLLDRFIDLQRKSPGQMEFHSTLRKFLDSFGPANLKKDFGKIIDALSSENINYFMKSLDEIGYLISRDTTGSTIKISISRKLPLRNRVNDLTAAFPPSKEELSIPIASIFKGVSKEKKQAFQRSLSVIGRDFRLDSFIEYSIQNNDLRQHADTPSRPVFYTGKSTLINYLEQFSPKSMSSSQRTAEEAKAA